MSTARYGITIPFTGVSLPSHATLLHRLYDAGYSDVWSSETDGVDGFTPLSMAAAYEPRLHTGIAVAPVFTRGPALLAQTAAGLAEAAPGRFIFGIGTSSNVIVENWNGLSFDRPLTRMRDTISFLRAALAGEKVTQEYETFSVKGFRLSRPPEVVPPLYIAALRPAMLKLAGQSGDGVILNWLSPTDVKTAMEQVGVGKEAVARLFVVPESDPEKARAIGRRLIASYLTVPAYAAYHRWLGRGDALQPMWDAWESGDRKGALERIPDAVVDDLIVHGDPSACKEMIARYVANGVTIPVLQLVGSENLERDLFTLAPR
jgi:probable F420-dependent oxidoreductase